MKFNSEDKQVGKDFSKLQASFLATTIGAALIATHGIEIIHQTFSALMNNIEVLDLGSRNVLTLAAVAAMVATVALMKASENKKGRTR